MFIYADQIQALPAAICRGLIRFLCVQVNLLRAAPLVHSRKKSCGSGLARECGVSANKSVA